MSQPYVTESQRWYSVLAKERPPAGTDIGRWVLLARFRIRTDAEWYRNQVSKDNPGWLLWLRPSKEAR